MVFQRMFWLARNDRAREKSNRLLSQQKRVGAGQWYVVYLFIYTDIIRRMFLYMCINTETAQYSYNNQYEPMINAAYSKLDEMFNLSTIQGGRELGIQFLLKC